MTASVLVTSPSVRTSDGDPSAIDDSVRLLNEVLAVDGLSDVADLNPAADLLSVGLFRSSSTGETFLRVSFLSLTEKVPGDIARAFVASRRDPAPRRPPRRPLHHGR